MGKIKPKPLHSFTHLSKDLSQNYKPCDTPAAYLMSINEHGNKGLKKLTE